MIQNIIKKISAGNYLNDNEQNYLDVVIAQPSHKDYLELYLAGLV